jgi:hypothetical protein
MKEHRQCAGKDSIVGMSELVGDKYQASTSSGRSFSKGRDGKEPPYFLEDSRFALAFSAGLIPAS